MDRLKTNRVIVTEGKYDVMALTNAVDALILVTGGFDIYHDVQKQKLLRKLAKERGLLIVTDSDQAGFQIRNFLTSLVGPNLVLHCYIPQIEGKESRKASPGKEGLLGVEGLAFSTLYSALKQVIDQDGCSVTEQSCEQSISFQDLYDWGLSGQKGSKARMERFLKLAGLPSHLNKKQLLQIINSLMKKEKAEALALQAASAES